MKKKYKESKMYIHREVRDNLDRQAKELKMNRTQMLRKISEHPAEDIKPLVI